MSSPLGKLSPKEPASNCFKTRLSVERTWGSNGSARGRQAPGVGIIVKGDESSHLVKVGGPGAIRKMPGADLGLDCLYQFRKLPFHLAGNHPVSKSVRQRFFGQEIGEVSCPVYIEGRTIRPYPVHLCARTVDFPKNIALFSLAEIHDFQYRKPLYFERLSKNQAWYDR